MTAPNCLPQPEAGVFALLRAVDESAVVGRHSEVSDLPQELRTPVTQASASARAYPSTPLGGDRRGGGLWEPVGGK